MPALSAAGAAALIGLEALNVWESAEAQRQNAVAIEKSASAQKECKTTPRAPRHHIFPQQFRPEFEEAGIDIDQETIEMTLEEHRALHSDGYNQEWGDFFDENPNASEGQIRDFATELQNDRGLADRPIIPF